jgi:PHD/YefM family antitoxin component YafN of YafNO toxin-antitoxin module
MKLPYNYAENLFLFYGNKVLTLRKSKNCEKMNLKECIKPVSYIQNNTADAMAFVTERREPVIITQDGNVKAVLLDMESYQSMKDAINMLRLLRLSERDVAAGNCRPAEKVFANLKSKYGIND